MDVCLDASISTSYIKYIITMDRQIKYRNNIRNIIQGGDIHRLFLKKLWVKWLTIYVSEEQHLPYFKIINNKG